MISKSRKCEGCPLYHTGTGFVPPKTGGPLLLVGDYPSGDDIRGTRYTGYRDGKPLMEQVEPQPFLGFRGFQLQVLGQQGVGKDYVLRCNPPSHIKDRLSTKGDQGKHLDVEIRSAVYHCNREYRVEPPNTKLIIASGDLAWDYYNDQLHLDGDNQLPLHEWRGFLAPYPVITETPVYGVNDLGLAYDKVERYLAKKDWSKITSIVRKEWPLGEPENVLIINRNTTPGQIDEFFTTYLGEATTPLVIDTEYTVKDKYLRLFGCGYHTERGEQYLQLYWSHSQNPGSPRDHLVEWMFRLRDHKGHDGFLLQNASADFPILDHNWSHQGKWGWPSNYHDTMLLHAKVESELPHSLGFLESIYSRRAKKKHLSKTNELLYHLGDLSTTLDCWVAMKREVTGGMWNVYTTQDLPVFPLVQWSRDHGIRVDTKKVEPLFKVFQEYQDHARRLAGIYTGLGDQFNINSDQQVKDWLHLREGFKPVVDRKTRRPTIGADALLKHRQHWSRNEGGLEVEEGDEKWTPSRLEERIYEGDCHPLLEIKAAYNWYEDKIAKYIRNQLYDEKGGKLYRVYPSINIWSQSTGRHSTVAPPLAQWPDELQDLLIPDVGDMWIGGDYSGQEVWLYSCRWNDEKTLEGLLKGWDTHTIAMCDFFDWPYPPKLDAPYKCEEWMAQLGLGGKKNPYRDWSKNSAFALRYYKQLDKLHLMPGARNVGMDDRGKATQAAKRFLEKNPAIAHARDSLRGTQPTQSVSWAGRVRKLNEVGDKLIREFINSDIQGGGADILNHTIIRACGVDPIVKYIYGVHDSFWFSLPRKRESELVPAIKGKLGEPYKVYDYSISIPIEWKFKYEGGK